MTTVAEDNRPGSRLIRSFLRRLRTASAREVARTIQLEPVTSGTGRSAAELFAQAQNPHLYNCTFITNLAPASYRLVPTRPTNVNPSPSDTTSSPSPSDQADDDSEPSAREIYVEYLLRKKRGYPLWIPSPNVSLPLHNRNGGVMVGDLGILTPEGGFDFLFNILHARDAPINSGMVIPAQFHPLESPAIQQFKIYSANSYLGSSDGTISRVAQDETSKISLQINASQAGVLVFPEDVYHLKHQGVSVMERYISLHLESWYRFIKVYLRPDIQNGDLRVIYQCCKSTGFGIATTDNQSGRPSPADLTFSKQKLWTKDPSGILEKATSGPKYAWNYSGEAEVKAGPSIEETAEVVYPHFGHEHDAPRNQCLFINTIDARVAESLWKSIEDDGLSIINGVRTNSSYRDHTLDDRDKSKGQITLQGDGGSGSLAGGTNPPSTISPTTLPHEVVVHPSDILNEIILEKVPSAKVSVVADHHWTPSVTTLFGQVPDIPNFTRDVFKGAFVHASEGRVHLSVDPTPAVHVHDLDHYGANFYRDNIADHIDWHKCIPCLLAHHSALSQILIPEALQNFEGACQSSDYTQSIMCLIPLEIATSILMGATHFGHDAGDKVKAPMIDSPTFANGEVKLVIIGHLLTLLSSVLADSISLMSGPRLGHDMKHNRRPRWEDERPHTGSLRSLFPQRYTNQQDCGIELNGLIHETEHMSASYALIKASSIALENSSTCHLVVPTVEIVDGGRICAPAWREVLLGPEKATQQSSSSPGSTEPSLDNLSSSVFNPLTNATDEADPGSGTGSLTNWQVIMRAARRWRSFEQLIDENEQSTLFNQVPLRNIDPMRKTSFLPQAIYKPQIIHDNIDNHRARLASLKQPMFFYEGYTRGISVAKFVGNLSERQGQRSIPFDSNECDSLHLEWPGYPPQSRALEYRKPNETQDALAERICGIIMDIITDLKQQTFNKSLSTATTEVENWRIGDEPHDIRIGDVDLVSLHNVSPHVWQPQLRVALRDKSTTSTNGSE